MKPRFSDLRAGARDILPLLLGAVPFSFIAGIAAASAGLSLLPAFALIGLSFVGASQLVVIELLSQNVGAAVVIATALVINARYLMYSASIAPHFRSLPLSWKGPLAYALSDPVYALSIARFEAADDLEKEWYFLGATATTWLTWQGGALAGIFLGTGLPAWVEIDFVIPLMFITLVFSVLDTEADAVAALTAGVLIVPSSGLPLNLGLMVSALSGIEAGLVAHFLTLYEVL